jgi:class 3 adenylate cyclase
MKKLCAIFLCIASINFSLAQTEIVDSLKTVLANVSEDTRERVDLLNAISNSIFSYSPDKAIDYGNQAKDLAERLNYPVGIAYALKNIGLGYYVQGNYIEVDHNWKQSLEIFQSVNDDLGSANLLSNLGVAYADQGEDVKAIDYYLQSLRISEKLRDDFRIASALGNIGYVYSNKEATHDQALTYYWRALRIAEEIGDLDIIGTTESNIGDIYIQKKEYDSALYYLEKSLVAFENTVDAAVSMQLIGTLYAQKGEFQKAVDNQLEAIKIATSFDAKYDLAKSFLGLGQTYEEMDKSYEAISAYQRAQSIAEEVGADYTLKDIFLGLANSYARISDYKNAFKFQQLFDVVKDSIYNVETDDKIKTLQFSYEISKREDEIEILEKNSEIEGLQIRRQKTVIYAGTIGVFLLILMGIGLYNRYNYVQRTKKIIEIEKDKSQNLLLNILPEETARELEDYGSATPRHYDSVSVMFTDFESFTKLAETVSPAELVEELDTHFKAFDDIVVENGLEKIKTIGDAYMCAGGLPSINDMHPVNTIKAGLEIQEYMNEWNKKREDKGLIPWDLRVGIHTGPVVAGVVGKKKYAYDIWGDTVNVASRLESNGEGGKVNISSETYKLVNRDYKCTHRGKIEAKNKGEIDMYFVVNAI